MPRVPPLLNKKKGRRPYSPKRIVQARAIAVAVKLRGEGYTYPEIGAKLNISHVTAWKYVKMGMDLSRQETAEDAEQVRDLEAARLDGIVNKLWPRRADARVADSILRVMDRRAKLLGLDVPNKVDVNVTGLEKMSDEELLKLAEQTTDRARKEAAHPVDPGDEKAE